MPSTIKTRTYRPVWQCIYCGHKHTGAEPCGKEHIIPYALDGQLVLPRSSCKACSTITREFEQVCARRMFGAYRLVANLPTRNPDERPQALQLNLHSGPGTEREEHWLPIGEYPVISAVFPELGLAGVLTGAPSTTAFLVRPRILNMVRQNEALGRIATLGKQYEVSRELMMTQFAKLLAKIAHSFAVAELGVSKFDYCLPPLILGRAQNLPDFIGGVTPLAPESDNPLCPPEPRVTHMVEHYLNVEVIPGMDSKKYLTVVIQLLQKCAPSYRVVVATL